MAKHCGLFFEHVDKMPPQCNLQNAQTHINDLFEKIVNALRTEHAAAIKQQKLSMLEQPVPEPFKITNSEVSCIAESILSDIPRLFITQDEIQIQKHNRKSKSAPHNRLTRTMRNMNTKK